MEWVKLGLHQDTPIPYPLLGSSWIYLLVAYLMFIRNHTNWGEASAGRLRWPAWHHITFQCARCGWVLLPPIPKSRSQPSFCFIPSSGLYPYIYIYAYEYSLYTHTPMIFPQMLKTHFSPKPPDFWGAQQVWRRTRWTKSCWWVALLVSPRCNSWSRTKGIGGSGEARWKSGKSHHGLRKKWTYHVFEYLLVL